MFIGKIVEDRMNLLGFSAEMLADKTMFDIKFIEYIIYNKLPVESIDDFDIEVLANALYCDVDYFINEQTMFKDVVMCSKNRGTNTIKSNLAKAKIQSYMKNLILVKEALC